MKCYRYLEITPTDSYKGWIKEEYSIKKKKKDSDGSGSPASKYVYYDFPVIKKKHKPIIPGDNPNNPYRPGDNPYAYSSNPKKHKSNLYSHSFESYPYVFMPFVDKIDKHSSK